MENITPMNEEDEHFENYMKAFKQNRDIENFDPRMLDFTIDHKTSLRYEYIKELKNENKRIEEMAKFMKETLDYPFPDEFYQWLSRDMLGLKYKKWEIDEMKRQYRIKKKRELKRMDEENKKTNNRKMKKKKINKPKPIQFKKDENGIILEF
jgi:hypothetical protein